MWAWITERTLRIVRGFAPRAVRRRAYSRVVRVAPGCDVDRLAQRGVIVMITKGDHPSWVVLACPCRCGQLLRVNVMATVHPHWRIVMMRGFTLAPSLDVAPCGSHFWLRDGQVHWVN